MLADKRLFCLVLVLSTAFAQTGGTPPPDAAPPAADDPTLDQPTDRLAMKYGMTWGYAGYTEVFQESFRVHCFGSPTIPPYSPYQGSSGGCNAYSGDTPCTYKLPLLCINKCQYKRPCYPIPCKSYAMRKEFYCGWTEGFLILSDPVEGTKLTSKSVGDKLCATQFGSSFVMAEFHDGKWIGGMDEDSYCYDTWPLTGTNTGGWGFYGYGVKGPVWTRFWVAINDQPANCWN